MKLSEVLEITSATCIVGEQLASIEVNHAFASDLMSDVLAMSRPDTLLITGLTTPQIIRTAHMLDLPAILVARGKDVPQDVVDLARTTGIVLLSTHDIVYVASGKLYVRGLSG
ncbi:MAG: hypothetical protein NTW63_02355 [Caldiserica bacterium]|nr:hypothetical protein [Caldisericota bacterium]